MVYNFFQNYVCCVYSDAVIDFFIIHVCMTTDAIGIPAERSIPKQFVWPPKYYESSFHKYIVLVFYTCD